MAGGLLFVDYGCYIHTNYQTGISWRLKLELRHAMEVDEYQDFGGSGSVVVLAKLGDQKNIQLHSKKNHPTPLGVYPPIGRVSGTARKK